MIVINGMRLGRGMNAREHWRVRARRVKAEREQVDWVLISRGIMKPLLPAIVTITRVAPSSGLDDDNLAGACKAVRDQIAQWIGVDDRHRDVVTYAYAQRRGPWAVEIDFKHKGAGDA